MNTAIQMVFYTLIALFFALSWLEIKKIPVTSLSPIFRRVGLSAIALCVLLLLRVYFAPQDEWSKSILLSLFLVNWAFILKRMEWSSRTIQVWLLFWTVFCTTILNNSLSPLILCVALASITVYKLVENFILACDNSFDDILPACVWLTSMVWTSLTGKDTTQVSNLLLTSLSINLICKWLPAKFIANDKYFLKRVLLSVCAGLALLLVSKVVLLQPNMVLMSALFALGIFVSYYFQTLFNKDDISSLIQSASFLVVLGILTLMATRLLGDIGLVILAAACCINTGKAVLFAIFWLSRLLIQSFVFAYVPNVTGINLMHPYCSAALYLGFLSLIFISLVLHLSPKKNLNLATLLSISALIPPVISYMIHEEATASFLLASNVVAISLVSFTPLLYKQPNDIYQINIILMPLLMAATSLLVSPLVDIGNNATVASRLQMAAFVLAGLTLISLILGNIKRLSRNPV